jgi:N6-L-threonylcarbamoyladenine synthase
MLVLGIETSCDETGVALYDSKLGLIDHLYHTQAQTHAQYGGVVPEITSRDHIQKLAPLVQTLLDRAHCSVEQIDGVAYTAGPGLAGALMVGAAFARSFAFARNIPAIAIHHMEGHLLSPFLEKRQPHFPFIALLVSGGHTLLIKISGIGQYQILGQSLDDAAGEAFDKTARLLGLPYPGGPSLAALAENGNPSAFTLPRPMLNRNNLDFSFSGLKTAVANLLQKQPEILLNAKADLAASFQAAVVDTLVGKSIQALKTHDIRQLVIAGGVSANSALRQQLEKNLALFSAEVFYPRLEFCTDNGAMIAYAGCLHLITGKQNDLSFSVRARWPLDEQ